MSALNRRLQILLDEERWVRLDNRSQATGASVGSLVRDAIDRVYPADHAGRFAAAAAILEAEPMPVADWLVMKAELLDR